jgi:hypothetical protein
VSTGHYGGASMVIPIALFAVFFPEIALSLFLLGVLLTIVFVIIVKGLNL